MNPEATQTSRAIFRVFLIVQLNGGWRLGLVRPSRGARWRLPGGDLASTEHPADASLGLAARLTGADPELLASPVEPLGLAGLEPPLPWWWADVQVGPERRLRHEYVVRVRGAARAGEDGGAGVGEAVGAEDLRWVGTEQLASLPVHPATAELAAAILDNADSLVTGRRDAGVMRAFMRGVDRAGVWRGQATSAAW